MEQLTTMVAQKTGISDEQAQQAVEVTLSFLKERLPEPIAGQIDRVVDGESAEGPNRLGGVFGS